MRGVRAGFGVPRVFQSTLSHPSNALAHAERERGSGGGSIFQHAPLRGDPGGTQPKNRGGCRLQEGGCCFPKKNPLALTLKSFFLAFLSAWWARRRRVR